VRDQRFVDNGKIVTAAGLSSGIEGALHVVEKLQGHAKARELALVLEYEWRPESKFARASLADRYLPNVSFPDEVSAEVISSDGGLDSWRVEVVVTTSETAEGLARRIGEQLERGGHWTAATAAATAATATSATSVGTATAATPVTTATAATRGSTAAASAAGERGGSVTKAWTFSDEQRRPWRGTLQISPGDAAGELKGTLEIARRETSAAVARPRD
jgi:hypothetical protein